MKAKILIADSEQATLNQVAAHLQNAGYRVVAVRNAREVLEKAGKAQPDLILFDLNLSGMDGLELCKVLRARTTTEAIPIVVLTARTSELDRVLAFEFGVNDYIIKPFSPREVVLRVGKQLRYREGTTPPERVFRFGEIVLDPVRHTLKVGQRGVELTATEFKLLNLLAERRGRIQSRERLLKEACGYEKGSYSRTVDTHIRRLRQKLGVAARYLQTVRGFGYRLGE